MGYIEEQRDADMARENKVCYWTSSGYGRRSGLCWGSRWFISWTMDEKAGEFPLIEFLCCFLLVCSSFHFGFYVFFTGSTWSGDRWGVHCHVKGAKLYKPRRTFNAMHFDSFESVSSGFFGKLFLFPLSLYYSSLNYRNCDFDRRNMDRRWRS